ncbi:MAG TPA: hypothetical protein VJC18_10690, partial [bacterium]|nr:hypothetical protein [bacterium]
LGTITDFVPTQQVAAQNDWNQNGVSDYDDVTPECSPATLQAQYTTEKWEQMETDVCYELLPESTIIDSVELQKVLQNSHREPITNLRRQMF